MVKNDLFIGDERSMAFAVGNVDLSYDNLADVFRRLRPHSFCLMVRMNFLSGLHWMVPLTQMYTIRMMEIRQINDMSEITRGQ